MNNHLPLNGSGLTDKIHRGLSGGTGGPTGSVADVLGSALAGNTPQPDPTSTVDGTGYGLSPSHKPTNAPATDPSQGRGNRRPRATEDPIMQAFQRMGLA